MKAERAFAVPTILSITDPYHIVGIKIEVYYAIYDAP